MRTSRILLTSTLAVAVALAAPAAAQPRTAADRVAAPYSGSFVHERTDCWPGTTCTPAGSASASTGQVIASMDMQRATADEPRHESGSGSASQVLELRAPKGASKLVATFRWKVRSATASVTPKAGFLFASTNLSAHGSCNGCTADSPSTTLVSTFASYPGYTDTHSIENVEKVLTLTIEDLPRGGAVRLSSGGNAYTDMGPSRVCTGTPGCDDLPPVEEGHAGTAHSDLDATLTSVELSYS